MEYGRTRGRSRFVRVCALLLALLMIPLFASCEGPETPPEDTTKADLLEGLNYKGETFTIQSSVNVIGGLQNSFRSSNYLIQGEDEITGDKASDSAFQRNKLVEEKLNIKLRYLESDYSYDVATSSVRELIKSGADEIQLIINDVRVICLCAEGLFHDAAYGQYFDFGQNYWYDSLMDSVALRSGSRYALMGDYFIDVIRYTNILLFNKDLYTKLGCDGESIYDVVRNGDWTLDTMISMLRGGEGYPYETTFIDRTGNMKRDRRDTYGLVLFDWWGPMIPFLIAAAPGYTERNQEGLPEITVFNERSIELHDKLNTLFHMNEAGVGSVFNFDYDDTITAFLEDRALILGGQMLGSLESNVYASSEVNFAILPYPKLNDIQKDYVTPSHDTTEVGFIPATVSFTNLQVASAVIEALSRITAETVIPKYYESTLKIRYARESANAEMIDLLHDHYAEAFALAWDMSVDEYLLHGIYQSVYTDSNTFASYCRMYADSAKAKLDDIIFEYELVEEELNRQYATAK